MMIKKIVSPFILCLCLCIIAWKDLRYRRIPNKVLGFLAAVKVFLLIQEWICHSEAGWNQLRTSSMGFLTGGGISLLFRLIFRGGIGAGDVKLFAVLGWWFGKDTVAEVMVWSIFLAAGCSLLLLMSGKISRRQEIPLAPFVLIAAGLVLVRR